MPNKKPTSYLRPLLVDFQSQPAVIEDLTLPAAAVKHNCYFSLFCAELEITWNPNWIKNSAVTVPLLLQESEENGPSFTPIRQQTNPSIPVKIHQKNSQDHLTVNTIFLLVQQNKNVAVTLPFAAEKNPTTDADDQPAGDLTSDPISGTVQQPSAQVDMLL